MNAEAIAPWANMGPVRRARFTPEERKRILRTVFLDRTDNWITRFSVMMGLSVAIASLGLLADSPAIVIGAMLIAPLMTPLQALSVAVAMGWGRRIGVPVLTVSTAVAGSVALAWVVAAIVPQASTVVLPAEVLSRTSPDLLDLFVALAAGAAGAYATAREDISAAIPGVAVAVALVPPLSAVGIAAQAGETGLALGALVLFTTNLVAILLAGILVLFLTGFVPLPHLRRVRGKILVGVAPVLAATVLISVPLAGALNRTIASANDHERVARAVTNWLGPDTRLEVEGVEIRGDHVSVDLAGPQGPPPVDGLVSSLVGILGDGARAEVTWSLRQSADVATGSGTGSAVGTDSVDDTDADEVRRVAGEWLAGVTGATVEEVALVDSRLLVAVASPTEPPPAADLAALLEQRLGQRPQRLEVQWTQRRLYRAEAAGPAPEARAAAEAVVEDWVAAHPGLRLVELAISDESVTVTVAGPRPPGGVEDFRRDLDSALVGAGGVDVEVEVRYRAEQILGPDDPGAADTDPAALDKSEVDARVAEAAVAEWLAGQEVLVEGLDISRSLDISGAVVVLRLSGPVAPPPVALLADALGERLGHRIRVSAAWPRPDGGVLHDQASGFPATMLATLPASPLFAYGSSLLEPNAALEDLARLVGEVLAVRQEALVRVASHTDSPGTHAANLELSRHRARAVSDWLVDRLGLDPARLTVSAYGEASPVAPEVSLAGRLANRRVEIYVEA